VGLFYALSIIQKNRLHKTQWISCNLYKYPVRFPFIGLRLTLQRWYARYKKQAVKDKARFATHWLVWLSD
jgi:hypothetical protein